MTPGTLLSQSEKKLLLGFFLLICGVFYLHLANNAVEIYNDGVMSQQIKKQNLADYSKPSIFSGDFEVPSPIYLKFFWIQFFTNPILFFLLRKPKPSNFTVSTTINLVIFLSLLAWNKRRYDSYLINGFWMHDGVNGYFWLPSHLTAFVLAVLLFAFIILQFSTLLRFTVENFSTKLTLE
ncbi:MAG TPA: hypothetical protein VGC76_03930 [Pyrinomonadaceae bacterium]|jgi:hypothetical protein